MYMYMYYTNEPIYSTHSYTCMNLYCKCTVHIVAIGQRSLLNFTHNYIYETVSPDDESTISLMAFNFVPRPPR